MLLKLSYNEKLFSIPLFVSSATNRSNSLLYFILWTTKNAFSLNSLALRSQEFIHQEDQWDPANENLAIIFCSDMLWAKIYGQAVKASNIKSRGLITLSPIDFCPHYCWRDTRTYFLVLLKASACPSGQRGRGFRTAEVCCSKTRCELASPLFAYFSWIRSLAGRDGHVSNTPESRMVVIYYFKLIVFMLSHTATSGNYTTHGYFLSWRRWVAERK